MSHKTGIHSKMFAIARCISTGEKGKTWQKKKDEKIHFIYIYTRPKTKKRMPRMFQKKNQPPKNTTPTQTKKKQK